MLVNPDFSKRVVITPEQYRWVSSPQGGVDRRMLDRLGEEPSDETQVVRVDTRDPSRWTKRAGREICPLFVDTAERVTLERLKAGERAFANLIEGGVEVLVPQGGLTEGADGYARGSWFRLPASEHADFVAGADGATLYLKTGHLAALQAHGTQ
jgi:anti-sigma factor ChrR (cupin superfamily)